jgi:hypothetical protein
MQGDAISKVISRCLRGRLAPKEAARRLWKLRETVPGLVMGFAKLSAKQRARANAMHAEFMKIMHRSAGQRLAWARRQAKTIGALRGSDER